MNYDLNFFEYKDQNEILKEVLVLKFFEFHPNKGFHLKYLSFRINVPFLLIFSLISALFF